MSKYKLTKNIAIMDDLCGFGKCSLGIFIPILTAAGHEVCTIPTALYTHHIAFGGYKCLDTKDYSNDYVKQWHDLNIKFDAIYVGNIKNKNQVDSALKLFEDNSESFILVDPVMGDCGSVYSEDKENLVQCYKELCSKADIITPNLTEACLLTDEKYTEHPSNLLISNILDKLCDLGCKRVLLTGIIDGDDIRNFMIDKNKNVTVTKNKYVDCTIHGAGDAYSSCFLAYRMSNKTIAESLKFASKFLEDSIGYTIKQQGFENKGLYFEPFLSRLTDLYVSRTLSSLMSL